MQVTTELISMILQRKKSNTRISLNAAKGQLGYVDKYRKPVKAFVTASLSAVGGISL
jgi:hypothetical protein